MPAYPSDKPRRKKERFARELLKDFNGARALKAAGFNPSTPGSAAARASQLCADPEVKEILAREEVRIAERAELKASEILAEVRRVALADVDIKDGAKVKALELCMKRLGLLVNKLELTGKDGGPVEVQSVKFGNREIKFT